MNSRLTSGASALVLAALGAAGPAAAQSAVTGMPAFAGYLEFHGAQEFGSGNNYNPGPGPTYTWSDQQLGGSGRAALLGSFWSVQGDAWRTTAYVPPGAPFSDQGISGHLTLRAMGGALQIGAFGSWGSGGFNSGNFTTFGGEAAVNVNRWRLYLQAGVANGTSGDAKTAGERDTYVTLSANYFLTRNLFVSANVGTDKWTQNNGDASTETTWGAKLEFKPETSPLSFFAAYEGFHFNSTYGASADYDRGSDHIFLVGIRLPFGAGSLQDLQRNVGLADLNPLFGDVLHR